MTTKQFKPGELLTAADVNQYLVNDPAVLQDFFTELDAVKTQVEELATSLEPMLQDIDPDNPPLVGFMVTSPPYDAAKKCAKAKKEGHESQFDTTLSVTFPPEFEIVDVIMIERKYLKNDSEAHVDGYFDRNTYTGWCRCFPEYTSIVIRKAFVILKVVKNA